MLSKRARTLILAAALLLPAQAGADARRGKMWASAIRGVGQLVGGDLPGAVASMGAARQATATTELDAVVGLAALAGGDSTAALRQLDSAIKRGTTEPMVFYWAARAALAGKDRARALQRMEQALAVGGDRPVLRMGHALILAAQGKRGPAAESLLKVAARQPNLLDPSLYPTPVMGAVQLLGVILTGFPDAVAVLRTRGHLQWRAGNTLEALKRFREVLRKRSRDADALQMSARCLAALGKHRRALQMASRALEIEPELGHARATRGVLLLEQGKPREAAADLQRAANALPRDSRVLTRLAMAYARSEKPDLARKYFEYALLRDGKNAEAHFGLALLLQQAGATKKASTLFDRALALAPGNSRFSKGAAHLASVKGDRKAAARLLARARRAARTEQQLERRVRRARGKIALQVQALDALARSPVCARVCRFAVHKAPPTPRRLLQAHLRLKAKPGAVSAAFVRPLLVRLKLKQLLLSDPTRLQQQGKLRNATSYTLSQTLPLVPLF